MSNNLRPLLVVMLLMAAVLFVFMVIVSPHIERRAAERCVRTIPIPPEQGTYRFLRPMVFRSTEEWQAYLAKLKATEIDFQVFKERNDWDSWPDFENAIKDAKVSFPNEVLVIVPYIHGSSSVELTVSPLRLASRRLSLYIARNSPGVRNADMNYACFALAVRADSVDQVELRDNRPTKTTIDLK